MFAAGDQEYPAFGRAKNLVELLRWRAYARRDDYAYRYLRDDDCTAAVTYGELDSRARGIASFLQHTGLAGERVLLFYEAGLDYLAALFGCIYAGVVAVPLSSPKRKALNQLSLICGDARPAASLSSPALISAVEPLLSGFPDLAGLRWLSTTAHSSEPSPWKEPVIGAGTPALLQYTSGSTGDPRGVILTHENLLHNQHVMQQAFGVGQESIIVSWLPPYHDMGLIGGLFQPVYSGAVCLLMSASAFLQRPVRWLRAISRHRGTISGGPNFAYDLCVDRVKPEERADLDLSSWTIAFNGAEPVRHETLERFAKAYQAQGFRVEAFRPCYGLAESTLMVTAKSQAGRPAVHRLFRDSLARGEVKEAPESEEDKSIVNVVGCGTAHSDQSLAIVDAETRRQVSPGRIGEVWVTGPSVAAGYWNRRDLTTETFRAELADSRGIPFLRTGDLGFVKGEDLYITGRLKDLIIINGRNIYPEDVEHVVNQSHPGIRRNGGAAFSVEYEGRERLVFVQEMPRHYPKEKLEEVVQAIRGAVAANMELVVHVVALVDSGAIPKTTSGKIRRHACRTDFMSGSLEVIERWDLSTVTDAATNSKNKTRIESSDLSLDDEIGRDTSKKRADDLIQWLRAYATERINSRLIDERRCIPPHIVLDFGNRGILGMQVGAIHGGLALHNRDVVRVIEQLAGIDLTLALFVGNNNALGIRPLAQYGNQELRDEMLPDLARGRELAAFALTEPGAGSNPRAISAKATRDSKGGWRISGSKLWIGSGSWAGVINVFVKLEEGPSGSSGMAAFAVRQGTKGLRHGPEALTMGMRGMVQNAIYLNDVPVTEHSLLGTLGGGLEVAQDAMMFGRLGLGATAIGGMKRCAQLMLRYAKRRVISTGSLLDNPVTLSRFAELAAAITATETIVSRTAELLDNACPVPPEVFVVCKIVGTEHLWLAADDLVQLLGGRGYVESNIAAQILRDARVFRIFEGPTETLQAFLGANVLHGTKELDLFLRDTLNGADVLSGLRLAAERIHSYYSDRASSFPDRASMLRWAHFVAGRMACSAILLGFVREAAFRSPSDHFRRVVAWAERQFERDLAAAVDPNMDAHLTRSEQVVDCVGGYVDSIGDIEQTLAGEEESLDWLLRRDAPSTKKESVPDLFKAPSRAERRDTLGEMDETTEPEATRVEVGLKIRRSRQDIEKWLTQWLVREANIPPDAVHVRKPFADFGLDSTTVVMLVGDLEEFLGHRFESTLAWDYPTIASMADFLANHAAVVGDLEDANGHPENHDQVS